MSETPSTDAQAESAENAVPSEITLTDLKNVLVLIDLCTQRGAFRAAELSSVGMLYEKINSFVGSAETSQATSPTGL